jgi:membrane protein implicated in regulation of membrane protease activity
MTERVEVRSLSQLIGDAFQQTGKLLQNEIDLAKAELGEKAGKVASSFAFLAAGGLFVVPALTLALFALAAALVQNGWSQPVAYLLAAVLAALIAGALFAVGMNRLDARHLVPDQTLTQLQKDKQLAGRIVR